VLRQCRRKKAWLRDMFGTNVGVKPLVAALADPPGISLG